MEKSLYEQIEDLSKPKPVKKRVRRTPTLSNKIKEKALKEFKGTDGKKQNISNSSGVLRDSLKHR